MRFEMLKQLDVLLASKLIISMGQRFNDPEALQKHLEGEISEEELQQINDAARREGHQPLSFSLKQ